MDRQKKGRRSQLTVEERIRSEFRRIQRGRPTEKWMSVTAFMKLARRFQLPVAEIREILGRPPRINEPRASRILNPRCECCGELLCELYSDLYSFKVPVRNG